MGFSCSQCLLLHSLRSNALSHNIINESNFNSLILNPRRSPLLLPSNSSPFDGQFKLFSHTRNKFPFKQRSSLRKNSQVRVRASIENSHFSSQSQARIILANSALTVILASANRVLYKLALVPMKHYPFFLAQFNTFGGEGSSKNGNAWPPAMQHLYESQYHPVKDFISNVADKHPKGLYVAIYFSILYARFQAGVVTKEMLAIPKSRFALIGILEALGVSTGMASGAMLPGPAIPILNQTFLVWQLIFSILLLGRRYSFNQILGCLLVASGVVIALASGSSADQMLSGVEFIWPVLMIASAAFQAGASIIKESVFIDASKRMKGKLLDIFVVNSFGSGFQALFVLLFLPFLSNLKGIPLKELPSYLKSGAGCFFNIGGGAAGCSGAPLLPLLYITINIAFNISALNLVKISSAVVSSLATILSVPVSIYILSLPLPYLPDSARLSPFFLFGSVVLISGLILYNAPWLAKKNY